jgi:hypothetical protein
MSSMNEVLFFRWNKFLGRQEMRPHVVIGVKLKNSWLLTKTKFFFWKFSNFLTFLLLLLSPHQLIIFANHSNVLCSGNRYLRIILFEKFKYLNEFQIKGLLTHLWVNLWLKWVFPSRQTRYEDKKKLLF